MYRAGNAVITDGTEFNGSFPAPTVYGSAKCVCLGEVNLN